ncbi:hypothetical protein PO909_019777 [Leuciscus waleckii]
MTARLSIQRAHRIQRLAASFQLGSAAPLKTFQRMLGCMASAAEVPSRPLYAFPPISLLPQVNKENQGNTPLSAPHSPAMGEPNLVPRASEAVALTPMADPGEERAPLSSRWNDLASPSRALVSACVDNQWIPADLPEGVINTITQSRAPSTRRLYAIVQRRGESTISHMPQAAGSHGFIYPSCAVGSPENESVHEMGFVTTFQPDSRSLPLGNGDARLLGGPAPLGERELLRTGNPPLDGYDAESFDDRLDDSLNRLGNHPGRQNGERSVAEQTTFSAH